ncbi:MAG TPA: hypothetical protein VHB25_03140 [Gemmatimonadaceae bacterium]|nr:hypothetical protein [Gemmatimonadaceae bacterium]
MRRRRVVGRWTLRLLGAAAAIGLWSAATVPSGYSYVELLVFAGPGMVLAIAMSWAAHAFARSHFTWDDGLRAGLIGGAVLPPVLAFTVALTATTDHGAILVTFVLGSWFALASGVLVAALRALGQDGSRTPRRSTARLTLHRAKGAPRPSGRPAVSAAHRRRTMVR